jgi:hypothetical protein
MNRHTNTNAHYHMQRHMQENNLAKLTKFHKYTIQFKFNCRCNITKIMCKGF